MADSDNRMPINQVVVDKLALSKGLGVQDVVGTYQIGEDQARS